MHSHNGAPCHGHHGGGGPSNHPDGPMLHHPNRQRVARIVFPVHCVILFFAFLAMHSVLFPTDFFTGISSELFVFDVFWTLLLISFLRGAFTSPGYVSSNWLEKCPQAQQIVRSNPQFKTNPGLKHMLRCPRSHRCHELKAEVLRMDHFCVHYNNAVGLYNYKFFFLTMLYIFLESAYAMKICFMFFYRPGQHNFWSSAVVVLLLVISILYFLFSSYNLKMHVSLCRRNMTAIEHAKMVGQIKAAAGMGVQLEMIHPWEFGLTENLKKMIGSDWWFWLLPVAPDLEENGYDFPPNPIQSKRFTEQQSRFQNAMQKRREQAMQLRQGFNASRGAAPAGDKIRVAVDKANTTVDATLASHDEIRPLIKE